MKQYKKILAVTLAGAMLLGNSAMAFAADEGGNASGEGEVQYIAKADVFSVVLPTVAEDATTFDYLLDPDGLISKTNGDRYSGKAFDDGKTVYFLRSSKVDGTVGGTAGTGNCDYTDKSDEIKAVNKSTQNVVLSVKATLEPVDGIIMKEDKTFSEAKTELYLALVGTDGTTPTEKAITDKAATELTATIPADPKAYTVKWNPTDKQYEKVLTDEAQKADYTGFKSYSFQLTGACNTTEGVNWGELKDKAPKVNLVWSVKDFTITGPQVSIGTDGIIRVTGLDGALYQSMKMSIGDESWPLSSSSGTWDWDAAVDGKKEFTLGSGWYPNFVAGKTATVTVTLKDGTTLESAPVTFDAVN